MIVEDVYFLVIPIILVLSLTANMLDTRIFIVTRMKNAYSYLKAGYICSAWFHSFIGRRLQEHGRHLLLKDTFEDENAHHRLLKVS